MELVINHTKISKAECPMRIYLEDIEKVEKENNPAFEKGKVWHTLLEQFWQRIGTEEEVFDKKNERKLIKDKARKMFYNAESFAIHAVKQWNKVIRADFISRKKLDDIVNINHLSEEERKKIKKLKERVIIWNSKDEKYKITGHFNKNSRLLYDYFLEEGKPLDLEGNLIEPEREFNFKLRNAIKKGGEVIQTLIINGRIDQVRFVDGVLTLVDYKSGNPWRPANEAEFNYQLPLYVLGFLAKCKHDRDYAKRFGREKIIDGFLKSFFIDETIQVRYFMIEALSVRERANELLSAGIKPDFEIPEVTHTRKVTEENFYDLIDKMEGTRRNVVEGNIYKARGMRCNYCPVRRTCDSINTPKDRLPYTDKNGNRVFHFSEPPYRIEVQENPELHYMGRLEETSEEITNPPQKVIAWGGGKNVLRGRIPKILN